MSTEPMTMAVTPEPPRRQPDIAGSVSRLAMPAVSLLAVTSLLAEHGFYSPLVAIPWCRAAQLIAVVLFLTDRIICARRCTDAGHWLSRCWLEATALPAAAIAAAAIGAPMFPSVVAAGAIYVAVRQVAIWTLALLQRVMQAVVQPQSRWHPVRLIVGTYLLMIVVAGPLLALPTATHSDHRNSPYTHLLNSLFLAGSAATGTGLSVYDFPGEYTLFGQTIVLMLTQAGGIAAMIFGTLFGLTIVRVLWPQSPMWSGSLDMPRVHRIVNAILLVTLLLEAAGAVMLYSLWPAEVTVLRRVYQSVFLAIGAFCNTGLCPQEDSLIGMTGLWQVYGVIMPLIVLGGLGFPILYEIAWRLTGASKRTASATPLLPIAPNRWSLHTKLVLDWTLALMVIGTVGLTFFETPWQHGGFWYVGRSNMLSADDSIQTSTQTMRGHETAQRFRDAVFQSAAARTTAFHTVLIKPGAISPASLTLMMGLMLIGGSAGSTAGGFHIVPAAILLAAIVSTLRRRRQSALGGSVIPDDAIRMVFAVFFAGLAWLILTILVLVHMQRADFLTIVFEAVSAFTTTGLSLGLTSGLTTVGKVMLLLTMLVGRTGLLALMLLMTAPECETADFRADGSPGPAANTVRSPR